MGDECSLPAIANLKTPNNSFQLLPYHPSSTPNIFLPHIYLLEKVILTKYRLFYGDQIVFTIGQVLLD